MLVGPASGPEPDCGTLARAVCLGIRSIRRAFPHAGMPDGPGRRQGRARCRACFAALTPPGPARPPAPRLRPCWRASDEPRGPPSKKAPRARARTAPAPASTPTPAVAQAPTSANGTAPGPTSTSSPGVDAAPGQGRGPASPSRHRRHCRARCVGCHAWAMRAFSDARPSFTRRAEQPGRRRVRGRASRPGSRHKFAP